MLAAVSLHGLSENDQAAGCCLCHCPEVDITAGITQQPLTRELSNVSVHYRVDKMTGLHANEHLKCNPSLKEERTVTPPLYNALV